MILARTAELSCLAIFAAASMADAASAGLADAPMLQLGALGLVGFMVAQNYRQGRRMAEVLDRKDGEIRRAEARANRLAIEFTEAVHGLTTTLAARPCIAAQEKEKAKPKGNTS